MSAAVWRRLPLRALLPMLWPTLHAHWHLIVGCTAAATVLLNQVIHLKLATWVVPLLFVGLVGIMVFLRWRNFRFYITPEALHLKRGGLAREEVILAFARVQGLQIHQSLLLRLFGLFHVALETAGSEHDAAQFPAVTQALIDELRQHLRRDFPAAASAASASHAAPSHAASSHALAPADSLLHQVQGRELVFLSLTSVQTLVIGPLLLGLVSRMGDHLVRDRMWRPLRAAVSAHAGWWNESLMLAIMAVVTVLLTLVLAVLWGAWRYGGYRLRQVGNEWHQTSGWITPHAQTLNPLRVCAVIWQQNFLQYRLRRGWLRVTVIGDSGHQGNASEHHLEGHERAFRVPWLGYRHALRLQRQLFALDAGVLHKAARYQRLSPFYLTRKRLRLIWLPLLLAMVGVLALAGAGNALRYAFVPALLWLALGEWLIRASFKSWRFAVSSRALRLQHGFLNCKRLLLPWSTVQQVRFSQSPLERHWQLASIELRTPFGQVNLPCLPVAEARVLFDYACAQAILP